jgi:hypothetical protein
VTGGVSRLGRALAGAAVAALLSQGPDGAEAQLFFGSRPDPPFTVGPLLIRASVDEEVGAGPVTVQVLWSLDMPAASAAGAAQDLYLLWPGEVRSSGAGPRDPALARYVEERGFTVVSEGRVALSSQPADGVAAPPQAVPGGVPFVVFVQHSNALGLSEPATLVHLPWIDRMGDRAWLMDLRLPLVELVKPRPASWVERLFLGGRHTITVSWSEVRERPLFPMYLHHRDRVVHLSDAPAELAVDFARSSRLQIDEVFPPTSIRRLSETREQTEVVSLFLGRVEGIAPQYLTVQYGYFSPLQGWALVLVPAVLFALGQAMGPMLGRAALALGDVVLARVQWGGARARRTGAVLAAETLARIVPGRTTRQELVDLCGPPTEEREQWSAPDRRTLIYRGRSAGPAARRMVGRLARVSHWEVDDHEVRIHLHRDVVQDLEAETRHHRRSAGEGPDSTP